MTDDINNPKDNQDKEYKPPEQHSQEFGASPMSGGTESIISFVKNQRAVAVVGGILFLYILVSLFSSGDEEDEIIVVPEIPVMEVSPDLDFDASPVSIFDSIDDMAEESNKTTEDLDRLKSQIASLNRQNVDMRNRVEKLDLSIGQLVKAVDRSSVQLSALAKTQEQEGKKETKEILQEYRIRAVISGRAWLEDGSGNNITVKIGDNLQTYGRVTKIKPVEGIVETSSGRTISFSSNE
jgi:regulator of replication initiation timing